MNGNVPTSNEAPSIEVVRDFWTKIVGAVGKVNKDDPGVKEWLKETNKEFEFKKLVGCQVPLSKLELLGCLS